jgi:hypothetical protein
MFAVPVLVYVWGWKKSKHLILDVRNIFAGSCTEHQWSCSKKPHHNNRKMPELSYKKARNM